MTTYRWIAAVALSAVLVAYAAATAAASDPTPERAFANLNAWRAEAGIPPLVTLDPTMSEGCRLHNAYLALNDDVRGLDRHYESRGRPGYTELGAQAGRTSNLSMPGGKSPRASWEGAVYHRMSLLDPRMTTTWFDSSSGNSCMGVGAAVEVSTPQLSLYPWPANGMRNVPLAFEDFETPNPYDMVPGVRQLGYLLSVNVNGPWDRGRPFVGPFLQAVSLTPDGGNPVAVTGVDGTSNVAGHLSRGFAIFPHRPLEQGRWYTARAAGYYEEHTGNWDDAGQPVLARHPFDLAWRFRAVQAESGASLVRDGDTLRFESGNPTPATVTVARVDSGAEIARRTMRPDTSWRTRLPAGEYRLCIAQPETQAIKGTDRCRSWSLMTVDGVLDRRRAKVTVAVPPGGAQRSVRLRVSGKYRECVRPAGGRRRCFPTWREVYRRTITVRSARTVAIAVERSARNVIVNASLSSLTVAGRRFGGARAEAKFVRRK